jgi:peptidoglycan/LPS O-acetylase OafA/YrhL
MLGTTTLRSPSPHHFLILDALRGIAAISVAIYHACIIFEATQLLPKAFLAVDFFFLLSGIVVAHAYEIRLLKGEVGEYMERRVIRLYPMIFVGALLGMSILATSPVVGQISSASLIFLGLTAALCLPVIRADVYPGSHSIAPLNVPSWSLFFELFVNVLYGFVAKRFTNRILIAVVLTAFTVEALSVAKFNGANVGIYVENFWWGFARVLFPFFLGVLINRVIVPRSHTSSLTKTVLLGCILVATLIMPGWRAWTGFSELATIAIVYPLLIIAAMKMTVTRQHGRLLASIGALSYPIYAIHMPLFLWLARLQRRTANQFHVSPYFWVAVAVLFSMLAAWIVYKIYDTPLREALASMRRKHRALIYAGKA